MNEPIYTLDDIPENRIVRLDNHMHRLSAYCEVHSANFDFVQYDSGSRQLKKKYNISKQIIKYFARRNFFFTRFSQGIELDQESWFSVIPEPVSLHLGKRLKQAKITKIFQPFCGVGGIAIHVADHFDQYVVNDIDRNKIKMFKNNFKVYGKDQNAFKFFCLDFLQIESFETDALIICPPWGGIDLSEYSHRDLDEIMNPKLSDILIHAKKFSPNIMLQMPKNTNIQNLLKVVIDCNICPLFTIQKIMTNNRVSQLFIYFGQQKFTKIQNSQLFMSIYADMKIQEKQEKKETKKKLKQRPFSYLKSIYDKKNPRLNRQIFF